MQHLKRRPKKCVEVQDSRTKEAQGNNKEIHNVAINQRFSGAPDSEQYMFSVAPGSLRREPTTRGSRGCSTGLYDMHQTV
jgi:hypothetical protein